MVAPDDHVAAESPTSEMMVTVVVGPSKEVVGASTAQVAALVLSSSHHLVSPHVALGTSSQRLDDDVMREFDATCRLSELTTDWGILAVGAASFGEKLQVSFP
jgi:nitrate/nitrite-specific signal transduction histidine kinase